MASDSHSAPRTVPDTSSPAAGPAPGSHSETYGAASDPRSTPGTAPGAATDVRPATDRSERTWTVLVAALGGEGGGVLSNWLVDAAQTDGRRVQATSVPGVAQRTGATTYYLEIDSRGSDATAGDTIGVSGPDDAATPSATTDAGGSNDAGADAGSASHPSVGDEPAAWGPGFASSAAGPVISRTGASPAGRVDPGFDSIATEPVMALLPTPGNVDLLVASELLEAGRAARTGMITPDRTTVIASTHRTFAIAEKSAMGDGRFDDDRIRRAVRELSRRHVLTDLGKVAERAGTVLSSVLLGAVAGSCALPIPRERLRAAIERAGIAVEANLRGFDAGCRLFDATSPATPEPGAAPARQGGEPSAASALGPAHLRQIEEPARQGQEPRAASAGTPVPLRTPAGTEPGTATAGVPVPSPTPAGTESGAAVTAAPVPPPTRAGRGAIAATAVAPAPLAARVDALPEPVREIAHLGVERTADYQDARYATLYLDRIERLVARAVSAGAAPDGAHAVAREAARQLALWMCFEDIIRVADLKTRRSRIERVRAEVRAKPGQPVIVTEFLKPGVDEWCSLLPAWLARPILRAADRGGWRRRLNVGLHVRTSSVGGFLLLWSLARLQRFRRGTYRYREEQARIDSWIARVGAAHATSAAFALEAARCANLVKGYGDTRERGVRSFERTMACLDACAAASDPAARLRVLREAALADPEGDKLDAAIAALRAEAGTVSRRPSRSP